MVRVVKGGEEVKISKRAGSYVTLRDLIEWTSKDAVRFFLLSRKPDTEYTFDVDLAVAQNNDNPVYYVQYAHARICSVLRAWQEAGGGDVASLKEVDLSPLDGPQAQALMLQLAKYPDMLTAAAEGEAPHDVTFYLRDLIEWTSKDAVRFFLLSRKPDTEYTFDVDLAVAQNNDNPVYYVQYAHARIGSVLRAALAHARGDRPDVSNAELMKLSVPHALDEVGEQVSDASLANAVDLLELDSADLSPLTGPQAQALMLQLAKYPEMLTAAAEGEAPHDVTFYLRDLAASYHSYYDAERILVDDEAVKRARLALVGATAQVLHNGLAVLGVSAPARM